MKNFAITEVREYVILNPEVVGSIPAKSIFFFFFCACKLFYIIMRVLINN